MNSLLYALFTSHTLSVVETWLSPDITYSELSLPNYWSFHRDWNHRSGGIIVYIKSSLLTSVIALPSAQSLELLVLSFNFSNSPVHLATFCRSPSLLDHHDLLLASLSSLPSLPHCPTWDLILLGDFNVNYSLSLPHSMIRLLLSLIFSPSTKLSSIPLTTLPLVPPLQLTLFLSTPTSNRPPA